MIKGVEKKRGALPVYMQLAGFIKSGIASGEFKAGEKIPSESKLAKLYNVSNMTVRQAINVISDEGLVKRIHGSGTYVKKVDVGTTSFGLEALDQILFDSQNLKVQMLKTKIERVVGDEGKVLGIKKGNPVILAERVILHENKPFCIQVAYLLFDPESPAVETMLDTTGISNLFFSKNNSGYKKGSLRLLPMQIGKKYSELLHLSKDKDAFKLEYIYYDFSDKPCAYGWFIIPHKQMPLVSKVGVWNE